MKTKIFVLMFLVVILSGCQLLNKPVVQISSEPSVVKASQVEVADKESSKSSSDILPPTDVAVPLVNNERIIGYTYPIGIDGEWHQSIPEGGFVLVACGNCKVNEEVGKSDGTEGNVFLIIGKKSDGTTPADLNETVKIEDYKTGHVQVTFIYVGNEDPDKAALNAIANMFSAPNCGQSGCIKNYLHKQFVNSNWTIEVFNKPPTVQ